MPGQSADLIPAKSSQDHWPWLIPQPEEYKSHVIADRQERFLVRSYPPDKGRRSSQKNL
jgi:hypothetical protein